MGEHFIQRYTKREGVSACIPRYFITVCEVRCKVGIGTQLVFADILNIRCDIEVNQDKFAGFVNHNLRLDIPMIDGLLTILEIYKS